MKFIQRIKIYSFIDRMQVPIPSNAIILGVEVERISYISGGYEESLYLTIFRDTNPGQYTDFYLIGFGPDQYIENVGDYIGMAVLGGIPKYFFSGPNNSLNRPAGDSFHYLTRKENT